MHLDDLPLSFGDNRNSNGKRIGQNVCYPEKKKRRKKKSKGKPYLLAMSSFENIYKHKVRGEYCQVIGLSHLPNQIKIRFLGDTYCEDIVSTFREALEDIDIDDNKTVQESFNNDSLDVLPPQGTSVITIVM